MFIEGVTSLCFGQPPSELVHIYQSVNSIDLCAVGLPLHEIAWRATETSHAMTV